MPSTDLMLLERWRTSRDAQAFDEIVSRYADMVYATCRRVLGNETDAQDVAQECFAELARARIPPRRSLGGWLHTLATHRSYDFLKGEMRRRRREHRFAESHPQNEKPTWNDIQAYVDEAIETLPQGLRDVVVAHFLGRETYSSIGRRLGLSRRTVTYRVDKAIESIRKHLKKQGVIISGSALVSLFSANLAEAAPAELMAILGKLALAGTAGTAPGGAAIGAAAASVLAKTGGILAMKTFAAVVAVACVAGALVLTVELRDREQDNSETAQSPLRMAMDAESVKERAPEKAAGGRSKVTPPQTRPLASVKSTKGVRVTGKVVDSLGNLIEGATVKLFGWKQRALEHLTVTRADGTFEFKGITPWRSVAIVAENEKMREIPGSRGFYQLTDSGLQGIVITLHYTAAVEGLVVDPRNRPVVGEEVTARRISSEEIFLTESAVTDEQGKFRIAGLLPGLHALAVIPEEAHRTDIEDLRVELEEGERRTDICIVYEGDRFAIAGRVSNEAGEPVEDARVEALIGEVSASVHTDEHGRYRLTRLPEGVCAMVVNHRDYESRLESGIETGRGDVNFVLAALPSEGVTGRVVDAATGQPITDFWITQRSGVWRGQYWADGRRLESFHHDEQGRFRLKKVKSKDATIVADAPGYAPGYAAVHLAEREQIPEVVIPLLRGHILEGRVVTTEHDPVPGAYIYVDNAPTFYLYKDQDDFQTCGMDTGATRSEGDGSFILDNLEVGRDTVIVAYHFDHGLGRLELTPSGAATTGVEIVLTRGRQIAGTVRLAGEPLSNAKVSVWHDGLQDIAGETETHADGSYVLSDVPEGSADVGVHFPGSFPPYGHRAARQHGVIVENGRTAQVDFDYPPGNSRVEGSMTLFGQPVKRGEVTLRMNGSAGTELSRRSVGIDGRYAFRDMPAGPAALSAAVRIESGDWIQKTVNAEIRDGEVTTIDVDLSGNSVVRGYVDGLGSFERGTVYVLAGEVDLREFTPSTYGELVPFLQGHCVAAYDGRYEIQGLEKGVHTIVAVATPCTLHGGFDQARFATTVLNLPENEEISLDFDLH